MNRREMLKLVAAAPIAGIAALRVAGATTGVAGRGCKLCRACGASKVACAICRVGDCRAQAGEACRTSAGRVPTPLIGGPADGLLCRREPGNELHNRWYLSRVSLDKGPPENIDVVQWRYSLKGDKYVLIQCAVWRSRGPA